MVKEFEMKKAQTNMHRASVSKTGTLDMGRLHTYKFNDDLFRKVTTLLVQQIMGCTFPRLVWFNGMELDKHTETVIQHCAFLQ